MPKDDVPTLHMEMVKSVHDKLTPEKIEKHLKLYAQSLYAVSHIVMQVAEEEYGRDTVGFVALRAMVSNMAASFEVLTGLDLMTVMAEIKKKDEDD